MMMVMVVWRSLRFWFKNLWRTFGKPRVHGKPFSSAYMRKAWKDRLREIDRKVNDLNHASGAPFAERMEARGRLLMERKLMIAKRRAYRVE